MSELGGYFQMDLGWRRRGEQEYTSLRQGRRATEAMGSTYIRDDAQNFRSLSNKRKYSMRPDSRGKVASPRSICSDSQGNTYPQFLNKKINSEIRSFEIDGYEPISQQKIEWFQTLNERDLDNGRSPNPKHGLWSTSSQRNGSEEAKNTNRRK